MNLGTPTLLTPLSKAQQELSRGANATADARIGVDQHGEQAVQEPENREGFDARLAVDSLVSYNERVYTFRRSQPE
jgi:hypothetical protein